MTEQGVKRKLTAILSADVAGYSRLMGEDDAATVRTLGEYREVIANYIIQYRGRVVDSPGDNLLAEFASVVDSVQCATEIQRELAERNSEVPDARKMEYRIGVNLGDVIEEGERIYGDGVNVAARLESLAEPGGICISGIAHDQVKNKLNLEYQFIGKKSVKNIKEPIRVYRVLSFPGAAAHRVTKAKRVMGRKLRITVMVIAAALIIGGAAPAIYNYYLRPSHPPVEAASVEKMAYPLPDKPSIAVMPFEDLSGGKEQEYFCAVITKDIITTLSKIPKLFVIARASTISYKGKPVKVKQVSEELGVQYVLEGSAQKVGDKVRITAQLIDATTGHHIWAERYDRDLKDMFVLQDEITQKIVTALQVKLTEGEKARMWDRGTRNLEAYEKNMQGYKALLLETKEGNARARQLAKEALALDPKYRCAYRTLGVATVIDVLRGWSKSPKQSLAQAEEFFDNALAIDESDGNSRGLLCWLYTITRRYEKAIAEGERAIALAPNDSDAYFYYANILNAAGRFQEAISLVNKAIRLNPIPPYFYSQLLGSAYRSTGQYEEAIKASRRAVKLAPNPPTSFIAHLNLAASYSSLGREEEARVEIAEILKIRPKFSLEYMATKSTYYKNRADLERLIAALRKAGLPEKPPLPLPDKPSIAVLPFANISGDPKEDYLSDGITEQIITALSKTPKLFVIARNSVFTYKGKPIKVQKVSHELGVRYVLEGSVQKSGNRLRITAQLIDAKTAAHLWAEKYDREFKDIFALQDEISLKVLAALQVHLGEGEDARLSAKGTDNIEAYIKLLHGLWYFHQGAKESFLVKAPKMFEEAIAIDPQYATPYFFLAHIKLHSFFWDPANIDLGKGYLAAWELLHKGLEINDSDAFGKCVQSQIFLAHRNYEKAIESAEDAIRLEPNMAEGYATLGKNLHWDGRYEDAISQLKKAIRLNPVSPASHFFYLGNAYQLLGMLQDSISAYNKAILQNRNYVFAHVRLAVSYVLMGRMEEARSEVAEVLRIEPKYSAARVLNRAPYRDYDVKLLIIEALGKAGLK